MNKFANLESNYRELKDRIKCANAYVGAPNRGIGKESVAGIVERCGGDVRDVCFVVIDVDGLDLEIFQDLGLKPAVIMMEGGHSFSPKVIRPIPVAEAAKNIHQPLAHILEVAKQQGYTPVCFHQDLYLVRTDLAAAFSDCPQTAEQLYSDTYYFLTPEQRAHIHKYRADSPIIRRHETEVLGGFSPNPLTSPAFDGPQD